MIIDWIYNNPTWLWGGILVVGLCFVSCLGLAVFHRLVRVDVRRAHNDLAGFTVAIISVVYAVLLAFIAIATWQSFTAADEIVQTEADYVGSIYRDTQGLPPLVGQNIRDALETYVHTVIDQEWPVQREGQTPDQGWEPLRRLHIAIVTIHPQNLGESVIQEELLRTLNELYHARESRLSAVQGHIPAVIWWIIVLGGAIVTGYTYLFGFHDLRMHMVMTAAVTASLALVVVLIIALDWPFRGEVSVAPDAFIKVQHAWTIMPSGNPSQNVP
jgi:hypothetical protein